MNLMTGISKEKISADIVSYIRKLPVNESSSIAVYKTIFFLLTENNTLNNYMENTNGIHFDLEKVDIQALKSIQKYIDNMNALLAQQKAYEKKREHAMEEYTKNHKNECIQKIEGFVSYEAEETDINDFEEEIKNGFKKKYFNFKKEFQKYRKSTKKGSEDVSDTCSVTSSYRREDADEYPGSLCDEDYNNSEIGSDEDDLFGEF